jgi:hypothetical protein
MHFRGLQKKKLPANPPSHDIDLV